MRNLLAILIIVLVCSSCKKANTPSTSSMLVGKWLYSQSVTDLNKNGIIDPTELSQPNLPLDSVQYPTPIPYIPGMVLKSDGTGTTLDKSGNPSDLTIQWLLYNDTTLEFIYNQSNMGSSTWVLSWFYNIDKISATSITFKDTVGYGTTRTLHWFIYTKQ